jgi:protein kinase-like protein
LGSYVVEEFVGEGAMGVVYRAYHAQLERTAAVKVLQALTPDTDMVARFRREAQSIGRMRHANVLNVFDFGEFEGTPYMVVEYVQGGSLASRTKQGALDRASALRFLRGIGDALDYAHSLGIVHRDVKPANVLLGAGDTPILADFGLAKLLQSSSIKSMTGVTTGTPAYMAPEQVTGSQVGPAADRYSLAVMAFEMLTGSLPFEAEGVLEVLYAHVHRDPPAPSSLNPQLGPRVDDVVLRGMAKDPAARWESCASFIAALEDALDASPVAAAVESTAAIATAVSAPTAPPLAAAAKTVIAMPPRRKRARRSVLLAILAAALVLVLIVGGVAVYAATRPTTLAVSPQVVRPGEHVVLSARHVPRNQAGEIQLVGTTRSVAFHANASGDVSVEMTVPAGISAGDYVLRICWSGACHAQTTLRVIAAAALAAPVGSA